jgi:cytochrome c oxidase cbb3-type subunit 3
MIVSVSRLIVSVALVSFIVSAQEAEPANQPPAAARANLREFLGLGPAPDTEAAKRGEPLYKMNCASCHGPTARGAQGPNLVRSSVVLHDERGNAIGRVIKEGRAQNGMPAFPDLTEAQVYEISEYIHLQVELAANRGTYKQTYSGVSNRISGDPEKGKAYFAANCSGCHSTTGDLVRIGSTYPQLPALLSRIAWPKSTSTRKVTVSLPSGQSMTGVLVELNDFDVALRDADGEYHSWPREAVKVVEPDTMAGHRALLPKYSDADLHNLSAYLVTVK